MSVSRGGGPYRRSPALAKNSTRLEAQLHAASGRSSKILKDAEGLEAVVEVPGRGTLTLSVQRGAGTRCVPTPRRRTEETEPRGAT